MNNILSKNLLLPSGVFQKRIMNSLYLVHCKSFSQTHMNSFYEFDNRGGSRYPPKFYTDMTVHEHAKRGRIIFVEECKKFWEEQKETLRNDPKMYRHGDTDVFFRFESKDCLKKWRVTSDKVYNEGVSECTLDVNDRGKAVFSGVIDTTPPKDGKMHYTGYCGIKSVRKTKSFLRDDFFDWQPFTHLELRVRGDGRNYLLNLAMGMYYDIHWYDTYSHAIYTHGGPYWQTIRIPFSKFYLMSKGRIQDRQSRILLNRVQCVGITATTVPGPFHLEIDYIGCHLDESFRERFAYELYKIPKEYVSS